MATADHRAVHVHPAGPDAAGHPAEPTVTRRPDHHPPGRQQLHQRPARSLAIPWRALPGSRAAVQFRRVDADQANRPGQVGAADGVAIDGGGLLADDGGRDQG